MVSTFGSLATAYSGLSAARAGIDVTGQNIANAGTTGYTRQRVTQSSVPVVQTGFVHGTAALAGQGVSVDGIARLGSLTLDAGMRVATGSSAWAQTRATGLSAIEDGTNDPARTVSPRSSTRSGRRGATSRRTRTTPARPRP